MRRFFCCLILLGILFTCTAFACEEAPIRLHVIAENDSEYAQSLKMKVKEPIFEAAVRITEEAENADQAYRNLRENEREIERCAREALYDNGYMGNVNVCVGEFYFGERTYRGEIYKEGVYRAVKVEIGKAEGRNWWCILYPSDPISGQEENEIVFYSAILDWLRRLF
ncbi:MAG: stage II sporulation protein R [Clostridia bacterium]|nr:stage II sporulation protein R [Clostridia bacterium]MBQ4158073.1 stage II sporulation protein R [Clostridia bacterium]